MSLCGSGHASADRRDEQQLIDHELVVIALTGDDQQRLRHHVLRRLRETNSRLRRSSGWTQTREGSSGHEGRKGAHQHNPPPSNEARAIVPPGRATPPHGRARCAQRASHIPGRPANTMPRQRHLSPSSLRGIRGAHAVLLALLLERVSADPRPPASWPLMDHRILDAGLLVHRERDSRFAAGETPGVVGLEYGDPPVLATGSRRRTGRAATDAHVRNRAGRSSDSAPNCDLSIRATAAAIQSGSAVGLRKLAFRVFFARSQSVEPYKLEETPDLRRNLLIDLQPAAAG